jgi:DNA polymerase III delta prime subunit
MSTTRPFPMPLSEKYHPHAIADFVGLDKPKRILSKFAANPYPSAWLFVGPPGTGKTTMALALAETLRAELHHISSQQCNVAAVEDVIRHCWYGTATLTPVGWSRSTRTSQTGCDPWMALIIGLFSKLTTSSLPGFGFRETMEGNSV